MAKDGVARGVLALMLEGADPPHETDAVASTEGGEGLQMTAGGTTAGTTAEAEAEVGMGSLMPIMPLRPLPTHGPSHRWRAPNYRPALLTMRTFRATRLHARKGWSLHRMIS